MDTRQHELDSGSDVEAADELTPRTIDCHAHFIPPAIVHAVAGGRFPSIDIELTDEVLRFRFPNMPLSPPAPTAITDAAAADDWRKREAIAVQVISPWTDLFGYTLPAGDADRWTRCMNEALAACSGPAARAMGTVSLQHPALAVAQLRTFRSLGLVGAMIGTSVPGRTLDDPELDPVWGTLAELNLPAFIHPIFVGAIPEPNEYGLANAIGRANATNSAVARLLLGGVPQRHPGLRLIVAHGGAGIPFLLARLARNHVLHPATSDPVEGFERLFFDSVVLDSRVMRALLSIATPDQVVLGSDWPFPWVDHPAACLESADLARQAQDQISYRTASRLFDIKVEDTAA